MGILAQCLGIVVVAAASQTVQASTEALVCGYHQQDIASYCSLTEQQLAASTDFADADYTVQYHFDCGPDYYDSVLDLGIATDTGFTKLLLGVNGEAVVSGTGGVRLVDHRKPDTYNALLTQNCHLTIGAAKALPSLVTLHEWQADAKQTADAIAQALDAWLLARSFDRILAFDNTQFTNVAASTKDTIVGMLAEAGLQWSDVTDQATGRFKAAAAMPAAWSDLALAHPELADLTILSDYATDIVKARPPVQQPADVESAAGRVASEIAAKYLLKLKIKVNEGQAIVVRASRYLTVIQDDLKRLSDQLAAVHAQDTPANP